MSGLLGSERFAIRMPNWLGDFVMAEPVVRAAHELFARVGAPERFKVIGPPAYLALLEGRFDGVLRATLGNEGAERRAFEGQDVVLFLNGSLRSPWHALRAGVPKRIGLASGGRGALLTSAIRPARERGGVPVGLGRAGAWPRTLPRSFGSTCVELAAGLGLTALDRAPRIVPLASWEAAAERRLVAAGLSPDPGAREPFLVAGVGARPGSSKAYPPAHWASAIDELAAAGTDLPVLLVGGPGEEHAIAATARAVRRARVHPALDPGVGLAELAALAARARLVLTADGGMRHVAHAVGARLVVVFGPTDPRHTADHLGTTWSVRRRVPCGPCHAERCPLASEPLRAHACMREITPESVVEAALTALAPR